MTTEQVEVSSFIYDEIPISSILYVYPRQNQLDSLG